MQYWNFTKEDYVTLNNFTSYNFNQLQESIKQRNPLQIVQTKGLYHVMNNSLIHAFHAMQYLFKDRETLPSVYLERPALHQIFGKSCIDQLEKDLDYVIYSNKIEQPKPHEKCVLKINNNDFLEEITIDKPYIISKINDIKNSSYHTLENLSRAYSTTRRYDDFISILKYIDETYELPTIRTTDKKSISLI